MPISNTFTYGGVSSSTYNITCNREIHSILPDQRKYTKEIPLKDGYIDFGIGGYGIRQISVDLFFDGTYNELQAMREQIIVWLSNSEGVAKQLAFSDEPNRYYLAKIYSALNFELKTNNQIGTIVFECNPPWQYENGILLTPLEIAWNTTDGLDGIQYVKTFTASGSVRLTNTGTQPVKPVIKLIGYIKSGLNLTYGTQQWQYDADLIYDGIVIDCANETVVQASSGANLFGNVNAIKNDYFEFASGQIEITVTATGLSSFPNDLVMFIEFTPQDMG